MRRIASLTLLAVAGLAVLPTLTAPAPAAVHADDDEPWVRENKVKNLKALSQTVSVDVTDQPVEDLFAFLTATTGAEIEPIYLDDTRDDGIDPETTITIKVKNVPALVVLERVLARTQQAEQPASEYTWQFNDTGAIEVGPKADLNRRQIVQIYDISELLFVIPNFDNAPEFDLSAALQSGQGGGSSGPFQGGNDNDTDQPTFEERRDAVIELLQANIEPTEWTALGGSGASVSPFGGQLVVTAPDYIHRQIDGYDFWPARLHEIRRVNGRTSVRVRPDTRPAAKP